MLPAIFVYTFIALTLVLMIFCCTAAGCAEDDPATSTSGADFTSKIYLFDHAKKSDGESPLLKDRESTEWFGEWTVTEERIKAGKVTHRLQFNYYDENGKSKVSYKNANMKTNGAGKKQRKSMRRVSSDNR